MDFLIYLCAGALAGLLSGLFGVGGGLVIVPILTIVFGSLAFPEQYIMHLALGTSLASIIFTSISSAYSHHSHGNVDWPVVRTISLGIVIGTLAGTAVAAILPNFWLRVIFAFFVFFVATQIMLDLRPHARRNLPGRVGTNLVGGVTGIISSLVGIGGGTLSVPFLIYCNIAIKRAIGTSAAIGLPIAVAGAVGYILQGWPVADLPQYSLGFVYIPALLGLALMSVLIAPLGAMLAQRLPATMLKRAFALLLYGVSIKMLISLL